MVSLKEPKQLIIDENSVLFFTRHMRYVEFPSDISRVREYSASIIAHVPDVYSDSELLEQQICELLKNAVKHGNKNDIRKKVNVWFRFTPLRAHLIVEDEGDGFEAIEQWNAFNRQREEYLLSGNFEKIMEYSSFKTAKSDDEDAGNALFAALEYWNGGVVFNEKRNTIAVLRYL